MVDKKELRKRLQKMNRKELIKEIIKLEIDAERRNTVNRRLKQQLDNLINTKEDM